MKRPAEHWVLCAGATHQKAPVNALRLAEFGSGKNLTIGVEGITNTLLSRVPSRFTDLVRIASYVLAADSSTMAFALVTA